MQQEVHLYPIVNRVLLVTIVRMMEHPCRAVYVLLAITAVVGQAQPRHRQAAIVLETSVFVSRRRTIQSAAYVLRDTTARLDLAHRFHAILDTTAHPPGSRYQQHNARQDTIAS